MQAEARRRIGRGGARLGHSLGGHDLVDPIAGATPTAVGVRVDHRSTVIGDTADVMLIRTAVLAVLSATSALAADPIGRSLDTRGGIVVEDRSDRVAGCRPRRMRAPTNAPWDPTYVGSAAGLGRPSWDGRPPVAWTDDALFGRPRPCE